MTCTFTACLAKRQTCKELQIFELEVIAQRGISLSSFWDKASALNVCVLLKKKNKKNLNLSLI